MSDTPTPRTDALYYPFGENATAMYSPDLGAAIAFARQLERELAEAVAMLRRNKVALDDWIHQYASEMCDEKDVQESAQRVFKDGGGTLAYVADIQHANRAILARYKE